jgi:hypothetical protein
VPLSSLVSCLESEEYYAYFGYCLLEGLVFDKLKSLKKMLVASPKEILEKGNMTSKVTRLIAALRQHECDTKQKCITIWKEQNPYFLLDIFMLWVNEKDKNIIKAQWPLV